MQNMALLCLTFQAEKHTELYRARQTAFMSQLIDLENTSAETFVAAYQFFLHFGMPAQYSRNPPAIRLTPQITPHA